MERLLPDRRTETRFSDLKKAWGPDQALAEANRCLYCYDAPCMEGCPAKVDVPEFIRRIRTGNLLGAARIVLAENVLGMSCARVCPVEVLCTGKCVLDQMGLPPIQVGRLQRYVCDLALDQGWRPFQRAADTGRTVAVVGAGPASLACAHELALQGHRVVVLEKEQLLGGLNTTAIAPYKMKASRALEEAEWLLGVGGIEVRTGVEVGNDVSWEHLESEYDAVFVGVGLGPDRLMGRLPGAKLPGVHGAVDYIGQLKTTEVDLAGVRSAVVVGGGNTAVDLTRELLTLGVPEVTLVYRRDEASMKGYRHEWLPAVQMGAKAFWRTNPVAFVGTDRVEGVRCVELDENLLPVAGSDFTLPADRVFIAIGQARTGGLDLEGIEVEGGRVKVDEGRFTGRRGWYAGGDCVNGGKEVVNAAADGLAAARSIHRFLTASE